MQFLMKRSQAPLHPAIHSFICCMQVAAALTGGALLGITCAVRLMLFVGGPSTSGSGMIVNTELAEAIRSHKVPP